MPHENGYNGHERGRVLLRSVGLHASAREEKVTQLGDGLHILSGLPIITMYGTAPQLRSVETDQTDPAGQYRFIFSGDTVEFQRAQSAAWATNTYLWRYLHSTGVMTIGPIASSVTTGSFQVTAIGLDGAGAVSVRGGDMILYRHGVASPNGGAVLFTTSNAAGNNNQNVLLLTGATDTPQVRVPNGSVSLPGLSFINATAEGLYRVSTNDIGMAANATVRQRWNATGIGFFSAAPVAQQVSGANLTNNVTVGGVNDTIADYSDLITYSNDAAAIRNDLYQLARKLKQVNDALRLYGMLT